MAAAEPEDILSWELCSRALLGSKFGQLERWQLRYQCQLVTLAARLKVDQAQVAMLTRTKSWTDCFPRSGRSALHKHSH